MDQSLRTVATQLLNVSGPEDIVGVKNERIEPKLGLLIRKPERTIPPREAITEPGVKSEATTADPIRRSINSKYNFFQASHPGQAMALTEEELERELASTRLTSTLKPKPTTTGGLSTWILLNPPSTTSKSTELPKKSETQKNSENTNKSEAQKESVKNPENSNKSEGQTNPQKKFQKTPQKTSEKPEENLVKITTPAKTEVQTAKPDVNTTESIQKPLSVQTTTLKVTSPKKPPTTVKFEKPTTSSTPTATTPRSEPRSTSPGTPQYSTTTEETVKSSSPTKKLPPTIRTTPKPKPVTSKPKTTTLRPTTVTSKATTVKLVKPGQPRPSKPSRKVTTAKPEVKSPVNVTSKIEKVTFKPVQMITTPRSHIESVPKPTFSTKIQASIQTEEKSGSSTHVAQKSEETPKKSVQNSAKPTNVLKVHLRKPVDTPTKIEIEPIKVNPPILTIEKLGDSEEPSKSTSLESLDLDNSQIDLKFDFSPESTTKVTMEPSTTTKKPKSKRKKHKTRRRKPSTTSVPATSVTSSTSLNTPQPASTAVTVPASVSQSLPSTKKTKKTSTTPTPDTSIQESKLAPESNSTKLKKKQTSKPLSAHIYSFLSREVMPSVGVMSLVGLGLGLASYFLYPFGGAIARRNYEVEPNYKYNPEEYGGNYGQSEEEVLKKVFQGMNPTESTYGPVKDVDKNYYRYQNFGDYTTRRTDQRFQTASVPVYRPDNTPLPYEPKYEQKFDPKYDPKFDEKFNSKYNRNTDFKYPQEVQTTTTYFDRSKPDFTQINVDRQFVVGSIPKGYGNEEKQVQITTEAVQTDFEKQIAQNLQFVGSPGALVGAQDFAQPDAQALRADGYEEIEITPTAVAVEHGPRSLNLDKLEKEQREEAKTSEKSVQQTEQLESSETLDSAVKSAVEVIAALKNRRKRESVIQFIPSRAEMEKEEHEFETEEPLSNEILDIIDSALPGDGSEHKTGKKTPEESAKPEVDVKINEIEPKKEVTTQKPREDLTTSGTTSSSKPKEVEVEDATKGAVTTTTTTTTKEPEKSVDIEPDVETFATTPKPEEEGNGIVNFLRKVAEFKFRLGLTVLKHASESLARYLGHVQKRMNGEE